MSRSIKITSIQQAEDYINRQERALRNLEQQMKNAATTARLEAEITAQQRVEALQKNFEKQLRSERKEMSDEMAAMDRRHQQAMKDMAHDFCRDMNTLKSWTANRMDELDTKLQAQHQEMEDIKKNVEKLYEKEASAEKKAARMLKDLQSLLQMVKQRTNHEKYAPGEWEQIRKKVETITTMDIPAAAVIAQAMSLTYELWRLEETCLKAQLKFEAMYNFAMNQALELLEIMNKNRNEVAFTDKNGNAVTDENGEIVKVELDFWTMGEYKNLEETIAAIKQELEAKKDDRELDEERLAQLLQQLTEKRLQQEEMVKLSVKRGLASDERVKISEEIINAMLEQGFQLSTMKDGSPANNYLGGETLTDQREGVFAILENPRTHTEISIIVHPNEEKTENQILFQRNDNATVNEDELRRSMVAVRNTIAAKGYNMGEIAEPPGVEDKPDASLADAEALVRSGIQEETRKRIGLPLKTTTNAGKADQ